MDNSDEARRQRIAQMHTPGAARVEPGRDLNHIDPYESHPFKPSELPVVAMARPERHWSPGAIPRVTVRDEQATPDRARGRSASEWLRKRLSEWAAFGERAEAWEREHAQGVA